MTSGSPQRRRITALGDLAWDVVVKPSEDLQYASDVTGEITVAPGGAAANFAVWVARCGAPAGFIGMVGNDPFAPLLEDDLAREGVEARLPRSSERPTAVVLVLVDQKGQRTMVTNQGADYLLEPEQVDAEFIASSVHLHITGYSLITDPPRSAARHALSIAKAAGCTVSLDPASAHLLGASLGAQRFLEFAQEVGADVLLPNREEGELLTGEQDPQAMARALASAAPLVVLKLGQDGCLLIQGGRTHHLPAPRLQALDATGAGDAFDAAFLFKYLAGTKVLEAAQFATSVAAWVVMRPGARPPVDQALARLLGSSAKAARTTWSKSSK